MEVTEAKGKKEKTETIDTRSLINELEAAVAEALVMGQKSIEQPMEAILLYNRTGMNGAPFFTYKGINIYPTGQRDKIEENLNMPIQKRVHGDDAPKVIIK